MSEKALVVMKDGREFVLAAEPYSNFWSNQLMKISGPVSDIAEVWTSADLNRFLRGEKRIPYDSAPDVRWLFTADLPFEKCARMFQKSGGPNTPVTPARPTEPIAEEPTKFDYFCGFIADQPMPDADPSVASRGYCFSDPVSDNYKLLAEELAQQYAGVKFTKYEPDKVMTAGYGACGGYVGPKKEKTDLNGGNHYGPDYISTPPCRVDADTGECEPRKTVVVTLYLDGEEFKGLAVPEDVADRLREHLRNRRERSIPRWDEMLQNKKPVAWKR